MKFGFGKFALAIGLLTLALPVWAMPGTIVATALFTSAAATTWYFAATAFAVNLVASYVIAKALQPNTNLDLSSQTQTDPGNRQQFPPATNNKLPVVYGTAWVGGMVVDMTISTNNQNIYYVIALSEVTSTNEDQTSDVITFGDIYWGSKKVIFNTNGYSVAALLDESTGIGDGTVADKIKIYLYNNGSSSPVNSPFTAQQVLSASNLTYKWTGEKQMVDCAFAIVQLQYSQTANIRGLEQTRFELTNSRSAPGDCFYDYLINKRYGASIPESQIDLTSLNALNTYAAQTISYVPYSGGSATIPRFQFDGTVDTSKSIMSNLQDMASSCDSLLKYNEITAKWGIIVQSPTYSVAMNINDSNIVSAIQVNPLDLASSFNVAEIKFANSTQQDSFDTVVVDLQEVAPELLFPNEPVNKQSVSIPFVNNNVRAQLIANRLLKAAREDLQVQCSLGFVGLQLEAGDIVSFTNANYGWTNKLFRLNRVTETYEDTGNVIVNLTMTEFNPTVYNDASVTQFTPADNSGLGDPTFFGVVPAPVLAAEYPIATSPYFLVNVTSSNSGITQYAELWYSAFANPTSEQRIFIGTTAIQSSGIPYDINTVMPSIEVASIPAGTWYFFSRMVNSLASSTFSPASSPFVWKPRTFQFTERYIAIVYGDSATGTNLSLSPTGKTYYGLRNQNNTAVSTSASDYTWYLADPNFGTAVFLCYANRGSRKFSFATGFADYAGGSGQFVPTQTSIFDPSLWTAAHGGVNVIDLDQRTGQLIETGTTTVGTGEIAVTNNENGKLVASLQPFLDFGPGVYQFTGSAATLTIDIFGRVVGFTAPDNFYYTRNEFVATAGQTVFTPTARAANYITGQDLVFRNGALLKPTDDYTETSTTVTLNVGAIVNDVVTIISFRSVNSSGTAYASFTRNYVTLTNASFYTASGFTINSGYENLFLNGLSLTDQDYDLVGQTIQTFPSVVTGELLVLQWEPNNLGVPNGSPVNVSINTATGQATYSFSLDPNAFNLYMNGTLLDSGSDYTTATNQYTLAVTPITTETIMQQQTFARTGAA
ncbi:Tip attachment protein J [uncultured Caudovirales phage]|uniref:Tip attachment protein J n=1 Tax=uncultured Caudovirales phage TaxID=2100421 RepID=A0A6J5M2J7_9CAUD|nr:Tip attachment protein J [uncultured Caudovirales phage]